MAFFDAIKNACRFLFKRKTPLFMFTSPGIDDEGRVQLEMVWNRPFIEHIRAQGFIGHNEEECVQQFILAFTLNPAELESMNANPTAHPYLNEETGNQVRR